MGQGCGHYASDVCRASGCVGNQEQVQSGISPDQSFGLGQEEDIGVGCCSSFGGFGALDRRAAVAGAGQIPVEEAVPEFFDVRIIEGKYNVESLAFENCGHIFNINLHEGEERKRNYERYYRLCKDHTGLQVTTSCFAVWKDSKKANSSGKVIPAVRTDNIDCVRVFFFDDNIEFEGTESSPGICNLRDITTGEFVDFTVGSNGFRKAKASNHTFVHYSNEFRTVLIKANILDAMEDPEYFNMIVDQYSQPGEKIIVYMDVNSTIVSTDSVQGKGIEDGLLSVMFELIEYKPHKAFDLDWDALPPFRIEAKPKTLKTYVKDMTKNDSKAYTAFWTADNCKKFVAELATMGVLHWVTAKESAAISLEQFDEIFVEYLAALKKAPTVNGVASSWFKLCERLRNKHAVVLNSFGVDTRKVVTATVSSRAEEQAVVQVAVNYEKWDERDISKFKAQFKD